MNYEDWQQIKVWDEFTLAESGCDGVIFTVWEIEGISADSLQFLVEPVPPGLEQLEDDYGHVIMTWDGWYEVIDLVTETKGDDDAAD